MTIDGDLEQVCSLAYETRSEEYDFMTKIYINHHRRHKRDQYIITGVSKHSRLFYSFLLRNGVVEEFAEPFEVKDNGMIKCAKWFQKGIYCIGGDDNVTYVEVKEEKEGSDKGTKKSVGGLSRLNIGIKRKRRKGFL